MPGIDYTPIPIKRVPKVQKRESPENGFWKSFRGIVEAKLSGPVNHIAFSPVAPYHYVATSGTNVVLYSGNTRQRIKAFSRFLDIAYSGTFRQDGKLLVAGDEKGNIKLFDVESKTLLRETRPHSAGTHAVNFLSMTQLVSASDDKTLCLYDIPTNTVVNTYHGHTDYVRSLSIYSGEMVNNDVFVSGSFDRCVKLWDQRLPPEEACVMTVTLDAPVSCLLQFSSTLLFAGNDTSIDVLDLVSGGKRLEHLNYHQKQVSALAYYNSATYGLQRVLSAGLDGGVKVIDPVSFKVTYNFKFPDPLLAVAVSPNDVIAVGTSSGVVSTRCKHKEEEEEKEKTLLPGALLGREAEKAKGLPKELEAKKVEVRAPAKQRQTRWDRYLRKFNYMKALDAALESHKVEVVVSVLEEMRARNVLSIAVKGRSDKDLAPLLAVITTHLNNPAYAGILLTTANEVLTQYGASVGQRPGLDAQLMKLNTVLGNEIRSEKHALGVLGAAEIIESSLQQ
ncbi:hypothetical protein WA577_006938 [Blastocystis sp. JDR]